MYVVNRSVAIIRPKQPYVDWVNSIAFDGPTYTVEDFTHDCSVFLLPEYDSDDHASEILSDMYRQIFQIELSTWSADTRDWPEIGNFKQFLDWFDVEFHSETLDVLEDEIEKEPYFT